jgi:hypothetical protein
MNDDENQKTLENTNARWFAGAIGGRLPSDGSGDEDDTSTLTGSRRGRGILTSPERVDVGQIHQWCLVKATALEMESASLINRQSYYLKNGKVYSDQFVTYQSHARPFLLAEVEERFERGRSLYLLDPAEAFLLQDRRGALQNPQLMSSLERRVLLAQFPDELKDRKVWQHYMPQDTIIPFQTVNETSIRRIDYELQDGETISIEDTVVYGVVVSISYPVDEDSAGLTEEDLERIVEHVEWVKEGRKTRE